MFTPRKVNGNGWCSSPTGIWLHWAIQWSGLDVSLHAQRQGAYGKLRYHVHQGRQGPHQRELHGFMFRCWIYVPQTTLKQKTNDILFSQFFLKISVSLSNWKHDTPTKMVHGFTWSEIRLALLSILNCKWNNFLVLIGLVCSSFVTVSAGTHQRAPWNPNGNTAVQFVQSGNLLASRQLSLNKSTS